MYRSAIFLYNVMAFDIVSSIYYFVSWYLSARPQLLVGCHRLYSREYIIETLS